MLECIISLISSQDITCALKSYYVFAYYFIENKVKGINQNPQHIHTYFLFTSFIVNEAMSIKSIYIYFTYCWAVIFGKSNFLFVAKVFTDLRSLSYLT